MTFFNLTFPIKCINIDVYPATIWIPLLETFLICSQIAFCSFVATWLCQYSRRYWLIFKDLIEDLHRVHGVGTVIYHLSLYYLTLILPFYECFVRYLLSLFIFLSLFLCFMEFKFSNIPDLTALLSLTANIFPLSYVHGFIARGAGTPTINL